MYGMVWYGMVWYGMVWYGMVWYGMVWYGMVWYGMYVCMYVCIYIYINYTYTIYIYMTSIHASRRPHRIRFAERSDLDELLRLEQLAWAENLRAKPEVIQRRLETSPTTNLVAEMGGRVVAVLYMQLVSSLDAIDAQKFMEASDQHAPGGRIVQLIAISADPEAAGVGVGSTLRSFALHLARVDPAVDCVVGVTRCSNFDGKGTLEEYVRSHTDGAVSDKTLSFHTSHRAEVVRLVPGFRPEDTANSGTGVLIRYRVKEWPAKRIALSPGARAPAKRGPSSEAPASLSFLLLSSLLLLSLLSLLLLLLLVVVVFFYFFLMLSFISFCYYYYYYYYYYCYWARLGGPDAGDREGHHGGAVLRGRRRGPRARLPRLRRRLPGAGEDQELGEVQGETCRGGQTTQKADIYLGDFWTSQPEQLIVFPYEIS